MRLSARSALRAARAWTHRCDAGSGDAGSGDAALARLGELHGRRRPARGLWDRNDLLRSTRLRPTREQSEAQRRRRPLARREQAAPPADEAWLCEHGVRRNHHHRATT